VLLKISKELLPTFKTSVHHLNWSWCSFTWSVGFPWSTVI